MRDALILAGLTIGAVAAIFGGDEPAPASPSPSSVAVASATPSAIPGPNGSATQLLRAGDGHFYAGVTVGGQPVTMMIDTGASVVALTGPDARAAGLQWNPAELAVVARGANGPIRGVVRKLDRVRLGAHEARGVDAVIIPDGLPVSLLGQSFLSTVDPVRIEKDRMTLGAGA